MNQEKACRSCRRVVTGDACPICGSTDLTKTFEGYIIIEDAATSEVAKTIGATTPGKYALKIK